MKKKPNKEEIMKTLTTLAKRLAHEEDGVTAIEYGLIAGLVIVVLVVTLTGLGTRLKQMYQSITNSLPATVS
jgi:pilus assembly protein Flp/PilA